MALWLVAKLAASSELKTFMSDHVVHVFRGALAACWLVLNSGGNGRRIQNLSEGWTRFYDASGPVYGDESWCPSLLTWLLTNTTRYTLSLCLRYRVSRSPREASVRCLDRRVLLTYLPFPS